MSLEVTGVLLALVSSDKVVFVTYILFRIGFFWFKVRHNETTGYQNIHQTSRRNMAVSHILENVNNFMQIFEPTFCELKPAECTLIHVKEFGCLARDQNLASVFIGQFLSTSEGRLLSVFYNVNRSFKSCKRWYFGFIQANVLNIEMRQALICGTFVPGNRSYRSHWTRMKFCKIEVSYFTSSP